ncbi:MAG: phage baseplate protein [Pseudomonadota bacterium]
MTLVAKELRTLRRHLTKVNRRVALMNVPGKVKPGSQDMEKRTVQLIIGKTADGDEVLSPPVRWQQPGAGTFQVHAAPADNEQMTMQSPSGTIGDGSLAIWGTYDDDHQPPSQSADEAVLKLGDKTAITFGKGALHIDTDAAIVNASSVSLAGEGGQAVARVGDMVTVGAGSSAGQWPITSGSGRVSAN